MNQNKALTIQTAAEMVKKADQNSYKANKNDRR